MKTFDEVVWCKTQEEWDAVIDWTEYHNGREAKHWFTGSENSCLRCNGTERELYCGRKGFYQQEMEGDNGLQIPEIISFQKFKEKYMQSQSPSEPQKFKSDGGSSDYYKITLTNKAGESIKVELGEIIRQAFNNDFDLGNIVKACRRIAEAKQGRGKAGVDIAYDANKIIYFANEIKDWDK